MVENRKGIILAGGSGTRLHPLTLSVSKQLLPVYDKPMIYYPLSVLMLTEIREIAIITTPQQQPQFIDLLGDGSQWGLRFEYIVQPSPDGLAQAYILAEEFLNGCPSALILGDNIFYGSNFPRRLAVANEKRVGGTVFGYRVSDPERYGVVEFDRQGDVLSLEEKPVAPKSKFALTGLYFLDERAQKWAHDVKPSARGELEIVSLLKIYLGAGDLSVEHLNRGYAWLDTGTHDSLIEAGEYVRTVENRQGVVIGCPEEIAFRNGWIGEAELNAAAQKFSKTSYGKYLSDIASEGIFSV